MHQTVSPYQAFWGETENSVCKQNHFDNITYCLFAIIEPDHEPAPVIFVMLLLNSSLLAKDILQKLFSQKSKYMDDSRQLDLAFIYC